jgi:hypothetical protein
METTATAPAADTIYRIDKVSEEAILAWLERNWPADCPVELVMEGAEGGVAETPWGAPVGIPLDTTSPVT